MAECSARKTSIGGRRQTAGLNAWLSAPDPEYARLHPRIKRLAAVSAVALGVIFWLSLDSDDGGPATVALAAGWFLMPLVLVLSLRLPRMKFGLSVPAALVSLASAWLAWRTFPSPGWTLVSAGTLMGATLGSWFWFRWAPVPQALQRPDSIGRSTLVMIHVALVVSGLGVLLAS